MKFSKEDVGSIIEILSEAEAFRPVVRSLLDTIKSFGPEIEELPKIGIKWVVERRIESVKRYEEAGFSREDAVTMTLDDVWAFRRSLNKVKNTK